MAIIPDMSGVQASGGGPGQCPPGWHLMAISNIEDKPKNEKGNIVHVVTFECLEPANQGKVCKENFTVTHPVGLSRYKGLVLACGFTEAQCKGLDSNLLKGRPVRILVVEEDFEIKDEKTGESRPGKSSKASSWQSGAEEFKKLVSAASGGGAAASGTPVTATAGAAKGDLGF